MIRVRYITSVLTVLFAFSWPASAQADVLELKSGQKLEGQYAGGSKDEVRFQVGSQTLKFPTGEVSRITIGATGHDDFRKAAKEALRQLRALDSVTKGGTTYQNYSPRVEDAKIKIDQFLDEYKPSPLPKFNKHVTDSLSFYVAASSAWNARVSGSDPSHLARNQYILKCAPVQEMIARERAKGSSPSDMIVGFDIKDYGVSLLWECARNSLIDAEKALAW